MGLNQVLNGLRVVSVCIRTSERPCRPKAATPATPHPKFGSPTTGQLWGRCRESKISTTQDRSLVRACPCHRLSCPDVCYLELAKAGSLPEFKHAYTHRYFANLPEMFSDHGHYSLSTAPSHQAVESLRLAIQFSQCKKKKIERTHQIYRYQGTTVRLLVANISAK